MTPDTSTTSAKTKTGAKAKTGPIEGVPVDAAEPSPFTPEPEGADSVVDELLGDDVDWQHLVRTYPAASLLVAFAGGCWLGLRHGPAVFSAVTGYLTSEATRRVQELLGDTAR